MKVREAEARLEMIRALMDRSARWPGLSAAACFFAAAMALLGAAWCRAAGADFETDAVYQQPYAGSSTPHHRVTVLPVWLAVAAASFCGFLFSTIAGATSRGEPALSRRTWAALTSMLPGLVTGALLTPHVAPPTRPGLWMLAYGTAVCALGWFAGRAATATGVLFLAAGALTLTRFRDHGLAAMAAAFGGLHILLGTLLLLPPQGNP